MLALLFVDFCGNLKSEGRSLSRGALMWELDYMIMESFRFPGTDRATCGREPNFAHLRRFVPQRGQAATSEVAFEVDMEPILRYRLCFLEGDRESKTTSSFCRWDVDGHLQGYGRSVEVLFTELGSHEVSVHHSPIRRSLFSLTCIFAR